MENNVFIDFHVSKQGEDDDAVGSGWENHFTGALAFYLSCDSDVLSSLVRLVLGEGEHPERVETQVHTDQGVLDMLIRLRSGRFLIIENKVDASLGQDQLARYLAVKDEAGRPAYVALFARRRMSVDSDVMASDRYLRPTCAHHWVWQDLFRLVPDDMGTGVNYLRSCFRDYLRLLGFAPANLKSKWPLLFQDRELPENQSVQKEFGRCLSPVKTYLADMGFKVSDVSHKGLQARPRTSAPYEFIKVYPAPAAAGGIELGQHKLVPGEVLVVSLVYNSPTAPEHARVVRDHLGPTLVDQQGRTWVVTAPVIFNGNKRTKLEIATDLRWFVEDDGLVSQRLAASCQELIARLRPVLA